MENQRFKKLDGTTEAIEGFGPRIDYIDARNNHVHLIGIPEGDGWDNSFPSAKPLWKWFSGGARITHADKEWMKIRRRGVEDRLRKDPSFLGRVIGLAIESGQI